MPAPQTSTIVPAEHGDLAWIDGRVRVVLSAERTGGAAGAWVWSAGRGAESPLHVHHREEERFIVLDGELRVLVGEEDRVAKAGETVVMPPEVPHAYSVVSETVQVLGLAVPGGFEGFFTELGTPIPAGGQPGVGPTVTAMAATAPRYGVEVLGPPRFE